MASQSKAFVSFDSIVSILPVILLLVYTLQTATVISGGILEKSENQKKFDKLVSVADYLVNYGLVNKVSDKYYPNWIMELNANLVSSLREKSGMVNLNVGFENADGTCIYRLVAYGESKEIKKLYVCGN